MPSSSARCAQLPRAADKVPYYRALRNFRDWAKGDLPYDVDQSEFVFEDSKLKKRDPEDEEAKKLVYGDELGGAEGEARYGCIDQQGIKLEPGTLAPGKKKRGRPKKVKDGEQISQQLSQGGVACQSGPNSLGELGDRMDPNGEIVKKRRGRPKKIHQQQKQAEREAKERERQQQHQQHQQHQQQQHHMMQQGHHPHQMQYQQHSTYPLPHQQEHHTQHPGLANQQHMGDYGSSTCFSSSLLGHKPFSQMSPYPHQMSDTGFFSQGEI